MRTSRRFGEKVKQVQASRIDSTQITLAQGHATTIEELENLNRDFAPARRPIAELCGGETGMCGPSGQIGDNPDHLAHSRAQEEMVVRDLVRPPNTASAFQNSPNIRLRATGRRRDVAHPRWPEPLRPPEQRRDDLPGRHVLVGQPDLVRREPDEGAFQGEFVHAGQFLQGCVERRLRQPRSQRHAQLFAPHALKVGVFACDRRRSGQLQWM